MGLPGREILWIGFASGLRFVAQNGLAIILWWSLLPQVPLTTWLVLAVVRMISTRLPLIPNKDLAFAAVPVALVGKQDAIAPVIVMVTSLVLLANLVLAGGLSLATGWQALARRRLAMA